MIAPAPSVNAAPYVLTLTDHRGAPGWGAWVTTNPASPWEERAGETLYIGDASGRTVDAVPGSTVNYWVSRPTDVSAYCTGVQAHRSDRSGPIPVTFPVGGAQATLAVPPLFTAPPVSLSAYELAVVHELNRARRAAALAPVQIDRGLSEAADLQSKFISETGQLTHCGINASDPQERVFGLGYRIDGVGEIAGTGLAADTTPSHAWGMVTNSSDHFRIAMAGSATHVGISVAGGAMVITVAACSGTCVENLGLGSPLPIAAVAGELQPAVVTTAPSSGYACRAVTRPRGFICALRIAGQLRTRGGDPLRVGLRLTTHASAIGIGRALLTRTAQTDTRGRFAITAQVRTPRTVRTRAAALAAMRKRFGRTVRVTAPATAASLPTSVKHDLPNRLWTIAPR